MDCSAMLHQQVYVDFDYKRCVCNRHAIFSLDCSRLLITITHLYVLGFVESLVFGGLKAVPRLSLDHHRQHSSHLSSCLSWNYKAYVDWEVGFEIWKDISPIVILNELSRIFLSRCRSWLRLWIHESSPQINKRTSKRTWLLFMYSLWHMSPPMALSSGRTVRLWWLVSRI
jgi:hypothetical protein